MERKSHTIMYLKHEASPEVRFIAMGDKLANMRSFYRSWKTEGDTMWEMFNQKDKNEQAWYYRSIAKLTESLADTAAWIEYKTLIDLIFGKEN